MAQVTKPLLLDETGQDIAAVLRLLISQNTDIHKLVMQAATTANDAAAAAISAVATAELPAVALESDVRAIVTDYEQY